MGQKLALGPAHSHPSSSLHLHWKIALWGVPYYREVMQLRKDSQGLQTSDSRALIPKNHPISSLERVYVIEDLWETSRG